MKDTKHTENMMNNHVTSHECQKVQTFLKKYIRGKRHREHMIQQHEHNGNLTMLYDPIYNMIHLTYFGHTVVYGVEKLNQLDNQLEQIFNAYNNSQKQAIERLKFYLELGTNNTHADIFTALLSLCQNFENLNKLLPLLNQYHFVIQNINDRQHWHVVYYVDNCHYVDNQSQALTTNVFEDLRELIKDAEQQHVW